MSAPPVAERRSLPAARRIDRPDRILRRGAAFRVGAIHIIPDAISVDDQDGWCGTSRERETSGRIRRVIVIAGSAGTGKRTVGAYLAAHRGFAHVDLAPGGASLDELVRLVGGRADPELARCDVVVTCAERQRAELFDRLCTREIEWVWFDGDRGALRPLPFELHGLRGVGATARFVDPFAADGSFRPLEAVVADVLTPPG